MKKVSIICPVYNSEVYLKILVESIQNQTYPHFECFLIDDCSTDNSLQILQNIKDARFKVIKNETNLGAQLSRKKGFLNSTGEYIAFIDSDDYIRPNYLKRLVEALEQDESDLVMCQYEVIDEGNKRLRVNEEVTMIEKNEFPLSAKTHKEVILSKPAFWNKLFTIDFLKKYLTFYEVNIAQDVSIMPYLFSKAKISYVDEILYSYRIKIASISNTYDRRLLDIKKSFFYLRPLKEDYYPELEFMAIGHYYYQISKVLFIKDKTTRLEIYRELIRDFKCEYPNYKKNVYFHKRVDYRFFIFILNRKLLYQNNLLNYIFTRMITNPWINRILRRSDR